ncbi:MAG: hypothetical protein R2843_01565, partial [Thermomicrobiales bacterium]
PPCPRAHQRASPASSRRLIVDVLDTAGLTDDAGLPARSHVGWDKGTGQVYFLRKVPLPC